MRKLLVSTIVVLFTLSGSFILSAQERFIMPVSQQNIIDSWIYTSDSAEHTSIKPYDRKHIVTKWDEDSLFSKASQRKVTNWLLNKSMISFKNKDFSFSINPAIEFGMSKSSEGRGSINTRGVTIAATIGSDFEITTSFCENQVFFTDYRKDVVSQLGVVPGAGKFKDFKNTGYDYGIAQGVLSYSPSKYFTFRLGNGTNFWGDGYRSLLLSDNASAYPYFQIITNIWKLKYVNMWAQFTEMSLPALTENTGYQKKWGAFHYLSWTTTRWLNLSFFEAVIWQNNDGSTYRGFDYYYLNPIVFYRPVEYSLGSPDNVLMGLNGRITLHKQVVLYGQLMLDEFNLDYLRSTKGGWWANKYGIQMGMRIYKPFGLDGVSIQGEFNRVRPYTYSHWTALKAYGHNNQPLAHPLGANFNELLAHVQYHTAKRVFLNAKVSYVKYGADADTIHSVGQDIFRSYTKRLNDNNNSVGQGVASTHLVFDMSVNYLINYKSKLSIEVGYSSRKIQEPQNSNSGYFYLGLKTMLNNRYYDF